MISLQTMHDAIITNGKFKKGQKSIFIQGASSGVGLIGLQIGKCLGASLIFGSSSDQTRLKKLSESFWLLQIILLIFFVDQK